MKLETKIITTKDKKWLYTYLDTEYEVKETYDSRSGWNAKHVILQGIDLSKNGFCFNGKVLLNHVRNYKEYQEILKSEEYKKYLTLKKKYLKIDSLFN